MSVVSTAFEFMHESGNVVSQLYDRLSEIEYRYVCKQNYIINTIYKFQTVQVFKL